MAVYSTIKHVARITMVRPDLPIGELFMLGFETDRIDLLAEFHDHFGLGGIIIFSRNFESQSAIRELIVEIKARTSPDLIVAVDQEGGRVSRLDGSGFPSFPSPAYYGERADIQAAVHAARTTARKLIETGINMNLAPVADVLTNPENMLMKDRCYSGDVHEVCRFVRGVIGALSEAGVASCAKHFPGLGDASIDPHKSMAISNRPAEFFHQHAFPPFEAAVEAGVTAIMTTHLLAPALDPDSMATFSPTICDRLLRESIGFDGVIITDDVDMDAVDDPKTGVSKAISAGHDMVLVCLSFDEQLLYAGSLWDSVESDRILRQEIARKISRVRSLKQRLRA